MELDAKIKATYVIDSICVLMAAHDAVWHRGAARESWDTAREEAIKILAMALVPAPPPQR